MSVWSDGVRKAYLSLPYREDQEAAAVGFLKAVHNFANDDEIQHLWSLYRDRAVYEIVKATESVSAVHNEKSINYLVYDTNKIIGYFPSEEDINKFFREIAEANGHKPVGEWDREEIKAKARTLFDYSSILYLKERFDRLTERYSEVGSTKYEISNALLGMGLCDPQGLEVTLETARELINNSLPLGVHESHRRSHLPGLKQNLLVFTAREGSEEESLLKTILGAAERTGLFTAIDNLLGPKGRIRNGGDKASGSVVRFC